MLDTPRRLLHEWSTQRKNQESIAALEAHLMTRDPALLVHQMGRAGSMTTVNTLRAAGLRMPVYHTHWLNPRNVEKRLNRFRNVPEQRHPLNVRVGRRIADELQRYGAGRRPWHVVTVFREPVARNLSVFFLSIEVFIEDFFARHARGDLPDEKILEVFLDEFPHEQPLKWFDEEIHETFGIDVYAHAFPSEAGYRIIREQGISLLLVKMEDMNNCYGQAFEAFLDVRPSALKQTHVTEQDPSYSMYKDFLAKVRIPPGYLDRMYESRFTRHFYTKRELDALRRKWGASESS